MGARTEVLLEVPKSCPRKDGADLRWPPLRSHSSKTRCLASASAFAYSDTTSLSIYAPMIGLTSEGLYIPIAEGCDQQKLEGKNKLAHIQGKE